MSAVRTTCAYCGVGCGVLAETGADGVRIQGDPEHPANRGRLCSKGAALGDTVSADGRLLHPEVRGRQVTWFRALDEVAKGFRRIVDTYGPDSVAFYVSGQLLTEDYYVANKLMKGYIGSGNIDTNSRLCMSSAVSGHLRAFGEDAVPGCYADLDHADLIVLVGSNTAWCHPIVYRRIMDARAANPDLQLVVIDPRRTPSCDEADLHLPLAPGTDGWLFNGLMTHLERDGRIDWAFLEGHTSGYGEALAAARESAPNIPAVARACGLDEPSVAEFFRRFAATDRVVTVFSQGINQSSSGADKVNAIINCHLLTGRIGRPGTGPFSITGQPNAMGGREVGGLASTLAAHMDYDDADRVQRFWDSPAIARRPGLKAVDLFDAVHEGRVRAVWIMATNPVDSMPDANRVREALKRCELVVVSDMTRETDTAVWADVLLPAAAWGEKDGTVTNSERRLSRQRPFQKAPGDARPDWWIVCEVARRMGYASGFDYDGPWAIFDEHARLSGFENDGGRVFDIGGLAGLDRSGYDTLEPVQWPVPATTRAGTDRLFTDARFATGDGRARFVPVVPRTPDNPPDVRYPLQLASGRVRDHWHTLTRTARSPRLCAHVGEPELAVHPADAAPLALEAGDLVRVESRWGHAIARVRHDPGQRRKSVFLPIHWTDRFASCGRVGAVVNPATCPVSGEPEFKHTPVRVSRLEPAWHGFAFAREPLHMADLLYWARIPGGRFQRYEMAGAEACADWSAWARNLLGATSEADWLEYADARAGHYRAALVTDDRLAAAVFVAPDTALPSRHWLAGLFDRERLDESDRMALLTGRPPAGTGSDDGPVVCSCHGVGRDAIRRAIRERGLTSVEAVGEAVGAGTNCGSCIPELREMLA